MSQELFCEEDHAEMVENFLDDVERYARSVAEHHGNDVDQIEWHLESEYPELTRDVIYDVIEKVTGNRPVNWFELVTTLPA